MIKNGVLVRGSLRPVSMSLIREFYTSVSGIISLPVVRWIAESVLLLVVGKIGIQLKDLLFTYEFAVQPIVIREIVSLSFDFFFLI